MGATPSARRRRGARTRAQAPQQLTQRVSLPLAQRSAGGGGMLRAGSSGTPDSDDEEADAPTPMRWAKSFGHAIHDRLVDTDGIVTRLYHYLWRKNAAGRTPSQFRIPDTARGARVGRGRARGRAVARMRACVARMSEAQRR
jgi:hypothetical protein